jgi:hypothetical protein
MTWRCFGLGLLVLLWLSACASHGGPSSFETLSVGQREADLVARKGPPQEIQTAAGGGKIYIYTTNNIDSMAGLSGGAWSKPYQVYYWLNDQGVITDVIRYPYGKHNFIFPTQHKEPQMAQASQPQTPPTPTAAPTPTATPREGAGTRAEPSASLGKSDVAAATHLELHMSRAEVQRVLGPPERTEGFQTGGRAMIVWYYSLEDRQGRQVVTPLVFEEGRLSGWGESYYRRRLRETSSQQP